MLKGSSMLSVVRGAVVLTLLIAVAGKSLSLIGVGGGAELASNEGLWIALSNVALAMEVLAVGFLLVGRLALGGALTVALAIAFAVASGWRDLVAEMGGCGCLGAIEMSSGSHIALIIGLGVGGLLIAFQSVGVSDDT